MGQTAITAATGDDAAEASLFVPDGHGPFPLVVFYPDAGGLRPAMAAMAERLVSHGYAVLQPNLFWRSGPQPPFDARSFADPAQRKLRMALIASVRADDVVSDTVALLRAVASEPSVRAERFGVLGYCMGGRMAFVTATALPERVLAAASIHGGGLVTDAVDSPHLASSRIRAAVYLGVADDDAGCTPAHQQALRDALDAAGVRHQLELYPGARHGFAVADFPVYDEAAAERHWERVLSLFREHVRGPTLDDAGRGRSGEEGG